MAANAANSVTLNPCRLLVPALGGALIMVLGLTPTVLLGAACFPVAASLSPPHSVAGTGSNGDGPVSELGGTMAGGSWSGAMSWRVS